ncbi:PPC domain-containing protein [Merismopedia glauca]|uniref:Peptidase n=2 Tax=Merismopedia TaxID=53402 RepID=A0A2T1C476_9CYAN|nr:PPC domain-containing protein [Merismopedia glauca]PSB02947.1 peptidase [Merismopedia glauca CCAP 1448/3]
MRTISWTTTWYKFHQGLALATILLTYGFNSMKAQAQNCPCSVYNPTSLTTNKEISDTLSDKDIPTGDGGFARDYRVKLNAGEQVAIDLSSDNFDTIILLMGPDGATIGQNDDGPDGSNNSLLFARVKDPGLYIVRVRAFGETGNGQFKLKITKLRPV